MHLKGTGVPTMSFALGMMVNKRYQATGAQATRFGVRNPCRFFPKWSPKLCVVKNWVFHRGVRRDPPFSSQSMMMNMADLFGTAKFVHLRFLP